MTTLTTLFRAAFPAEYAAAWFLFTYIAPLRRR